MPQIGSLVSAGTASFESSYLPQYLQIGQVNNSDTIGALNIKAFGESLINLNDSAQIDALLKLEQNILAAGTNTALGKQLLLSNGRVNGASTIINISNGGTSTTAVYENSGGFAPAQATFLRKVDTLPVVANGNQDVSGFDCIFMLPANVTQVQVTFANGFEETMTTDELAGLYTRLFPGEASGLVNGFVVIAGAERARAAGNEALGVVKAKIFAGASNVVVVKSAFQKR